MKIRTKGYYRICPICKKKFQCRDKWDYKHHETCSRRCAMLLRIKKSSNYAIAKPIIDYVKKHHGPNFKGGFLSKHGKHIWLAPNKYRLEHQLVMEKYLKRKLRANEIIHHIDGDKLNNRIENLFMCSRSKHRQTHFTMEKIVFQLFKQGKIEFNREAGKYYL